MCCWALAFNPLTLEQEILTAFNFGGFLLGPLVPESNQSISSCSRDYVAGCVICSFQTRDVFIGLGNNTIRPQVGGLETERII